MPSSKTAIFTGILFFVLLAITGQAHEHGPRRRRHGHFDHVHHPAQFPVHAAQVTLAPFAGEFPAEATSGIIELSRSSSTSTTRRPGPMPYFPGPPQPGNTAGPEKASVFERFVAGSAPKAQFSSAPPSSPNRRPDSEKAPWLFLAAAGFFVVSLVWNLYSQVGMNREKAMATDDDAVVANRMGNMNYGGLGDEKAHGQGKWLQDNMASAPISAV